MGDYGSMILDGDGCGRLWECDIGWGWFWEIMKSVILDGDGCGRLWKYDIGWGWLWEIMGV